MLTKLQIAIAFRQADSCVSKTINQQQISNELINFFALKGLQSTPSTMVYV